MEEMLKKIIEYLGEQGGILAFHRLHESTNQSLQWMVSFEFGQEAADSPMVGGAAYGTGATAEDAVKQVFEQCGLDKETVELPELGHTFAPSANVGWRCGWVAEGSQEPCGRHEQDH